MLNRSLKNTLAFGTCIFVCLFSLEEARGQEVTSDSIRTAAADLADCYRLGASEEPDWLMELEHDLRLLSIEIFRPEEQPSQHPEFLVTPAEDERASSYSHLTWTLIDEAKVLQVSWNSPLSGVVLTFPPVSVGGRVMGRIHYYSDEPEEDDEVIVGVERSYC